MQARKTLFFKEDIPWVKKEQNEDFDVLMSCFDGAEVCELVGSYIFLQSIQLFEHHSAGLYRDDGLAILKSLSVPETDRVKKKKLIKVFKYCRLKITIKSNLHIMNLLDITLNLRNNTYEPCRKPDSCPVYISKNANHPKAILRELPKAISKRLATCHLTKKFFEKQHHYILKN